MDVSRPFDPRVLALGRRLVSSLLDDERDDPLSAWMAHYIAGLMIAIESAQSDAEREVAHARCMGAILKLWDHRCTLPGNAQPFGKARSAIEYLIRMDPHSQESMFFRVRPDRPQGRLTSEWLVRAENVDAAARMLVLHCLGQAIECDAPELRAWVELAPQLDAGKDGTDVALAAALAELVEDENQAPSQDVQQRLIESIDAMLHELTALRDDLDTDFGG